MASSGEDARGRATMLGGLDDAETARFLDLVTAELEARGVRVVVDHDVVVLGEQELGLDSVARQCKTIDQAQWKNTLRRYFDATLNAAQSKEKLHDYAAVAPRLVVRAYQDDPKIRSSLVTRTDIPGVLAAIALDLEDAVQSVTPDTAAAWGKSSAELFDTALGNLKRRPVTPHSWDMGKTKLFTISEEYFGASYALLLESYPQLLGRLGAFVGVPVRNQLICLPFIGSESMDMMNQLLSMVDAMHKNEPYPVSPVLFYYRDGVFEPILATLQGGSLSVQIPPRLAEVLKSMYLPGVEKVAASRAPTPSAGSQRLDTSRFSIWLEKGWTADSAIGLMLNNRRYPEAFVSVMALGVAPTAESLENLAIMGADFTGPPTAPVVPEPQRIGALSGFSCTSQNGGTGMKSMALALDSALVLKCTCSAPSSQFVEVCAAMERMLATLTPPGAVNTGSRNSCRSAP